MTLDLSSETVESARPDTTDRADSGNTGLPYDWAPAPASASGGGDEGRRDEDGQDGGGGHVQKARHEGRLDLRNSWQVVAGSVLIPLGIIFILIGWYGAAHARVVQQQIPYMVSGSFIGLGCMVVGGFLFWGHWLYRIYDQAELHHEEQQQLLELIAASLMGQSPQAHGTIGSQSPSASTAPSTGENSTATGAEVHAPATSYYATATGSVYHRADCAVIAHHPDDLRVLGPDGVSGLRPCQICAPRS
jgi:hypothetical protein